MGQSLRQRQIVLTSGCRLLRSNKGWDSSTLRKHGPSGVLPQYNQIFSRTAHQRFQLLQAEPDSVARAVRKIKVHSKHGSVLSPQPFVWGERHQKALEKLLDHLASAVRSLIYFTSWLDVWSFTWFFKNRQPPGRSSMIVRWDFQAYSLEIESCCASYRSEVGQENSGLIGGRGYMLWLGRKGTFLYSRPELEDGPLSLEYCSLHFTFCSCKGKNMI